MTELILKALKNIQSSGSFCCKLDFPFTDLDLDVKSAGRLSFPLNRKTAAALIKEASAAKYGLRDQTLLDKNVRNAWEISKTKLKTGQNWQNSLRSLLDRIQEKLGLPDHLSLVAQLYNLLIYEPGQFFKYHQDTEKAEDMIGTLLIVLPSQHTGGDLVIDNHGEKKTFRSSQFSLDKLTAVAFYTDCHHTVKEVTKGYRVVLTYNLLVVKTDAAAVKAQPDTHQDALIRSLKKFFATDPLSQNNKKTMMMPQHLVYLLDHDYTEYGLSWQGLKNIDALRGTALKAAAQALQLDIHLCLADVHETWSCEPEFDSRYRYRKYREEEEEDEDEENPDVELTDLIDEDIELRHWLDEDGKSVAFPEYSPHGSACHLIFTKAHNELKPFNSEYEGFTGNAGDTMDHWYHRAAIVLWPSRDRNSMRFGFDRAGLLRELLKQMTVKSSWPRALEVLRSFLPYWPPVMQEDIQLANEAPLLLRLALAVADEKLAFILVSTFDFSALTATTAKHLLKLQNAYGMTWCQKLLAAWMERPVRWHYGKNEESIQAIVEVLVQLPDHAKLTDDVLQYQMKKLIKNDSSALQNESLVEHFRKLPERMTALTDFLLSCASAKAGTHFMEWIEHVMTHREIYPCAALGESLVRHKKIIERLPQGKIIYGKLHEYVLADLQAQAKKGRRAADNWSIECKYKCHCTDCTALKQFLHSSETRILRWPMAKDRRQHIHRIIEQLMIPVSHETERKGSPYVLVLNKLAKLHMEEATQFTKMKHMLTKLEAVST